MHLLFVEDISHLLIFKKDKEICFNRRNAPISNMQDIKYWLCTSLLDCFCQPWHPVSLLGLPHGCVVLVYCLGMVTHKRAISMESAHPKHIILTVIIANTHNFNNILLISVA